MASTKKAADQKKVAPEKKAAPKTSKAKGLKLGGVPTKGGK